MTARVPVLTFSDNEHSRSSQALDNGIVLKSFTDVTINERTKSKATKSKFETKVKENDLLTNCSCYYRYFS